MLVVNLGVEDFGDFKFWFIIDMIGGGGGWNSIRNQIRIAGFQHRDVNTGLLWHGGCPSEGDRMGVGSARILYRPRNIMDSF